MQRPLLLLLVALPLSAALSQDATDRVNHRSMEAFTLEDNLRQLRDEVGGGARYDSNARSRGMGFGRLPDGLDEQLKTFGVWNMSESGQRRRKD